MPEKLMTYIRHEKIDNKFKEDYRFW
jgi:hypothetical protein